MGRMGPGKRVRWADLLDIDDDNDDCDDDLEIDQPVASACLDVSIDIWMSQELGKKENSVEN